MSNESETWMRFAGDGEKRETMTQDRIGFLKLLEFEDKARESAQWLRFAEAFVPTAQDCHAYGEHQKVANYAADFADAMVLEAKNRGRL